MNAPIRFNIKDRFVCLMLVIVTFGIYWNALGYGFLIIDDSLFLGNPLIRSGFSIDGIKWIFSSFYGKYWVPLNWLSHMLDFQLYGDSPFGHRFTNLTLHAGNATLLFLFFRMATGSIWRSAAVAALFAVHPLNVESVVWITERNNVLSTFGGLLTLIFYLRYVQQSRVSWYIASICCFAFSLMSKPMLVTLPLVMLLLDYWPLGRIEKTTGRYTGQKKNLLFNFIVNISAQKRLLYEKIPFFLFSIFFAVLTYVTVSQNSSQIVFGEIFPLKVRIFNAFVSYKLYILKMVWPENLAFFYPHHGGAISILEFAGACLSIIILCFLALWYIKFRPYIFVGWSWFMITLTPVIGITQVFFQAMADRFTYVPLIGLFTAIVWITAAITRSRRISKLTTMLLFGTITAYFMTNTYNQTLYWQDSRTLYEHTLKVTKDNYFAHMVLADFEYNSGNKNKADFHIEKAVAINPRFVAVMYNNKGIQLAENGKSDKALSYFKKALKLCPDFQYASYNCGVVLANEGQFSEAIKLLSNVSKENPYYSRAVKIRSFCIEMQGKER